MDANYSSLLHSCRRDCSEYRLFMARNRFDDGVFPFQEQTLPYLPVWPAFPIGVRPDRNVLWYSHLFGLQRRKRIRSGQMAKIRVLHFLSAASDGSMGFTKIFGLMGINPNIFLGLTNTMIYCNWQIP